MILVAKTTPGGVDLGASETLSETIEVRGGEGGIRTHGGIAATPVFKTGALNRSATSPDRSFRHAHRAEPAIEALSPPERRA